MEALGQQSYLYYSEVVMVEENMQEIALSRLQSFFPDEGYTEELVAEKIAEKDIHIYPADMLPFLQSALLGDKIVEIKIDRDERVFFTRLCDLPASLLAELEAELEAKIEYELKKKQEAETTDDNPEQIKEGAETEEEPKKVPIQGFYLEKMTQILTLPIEPGIGNHLIRKSDKVVVRVFTSLYAIELGTKFEEVLTENGLSVIKLGYPTIARIVRDAREFRAKVSSSMDLKLTIIPTRKRNTIICKVVDVSAKGLGLIIPRESKKKLKLEDAVRVKVTLDERDMFTVAGRIKHLSKLRADSEMQFICGLQLDLASQSEKSLVETLLARVQRVYLQDLAEKSLEHGVSILA